MARTWTRGPAIGRGSTATISTATALVSGEVFAVKSAEVSNSEFLKREQRMLSSLRPCSQVVAYRGCDISKENGKVLYNLFMEYAPGGALTDAIGENGGRLDETAIRSHTKTILLGLKHLHSNGIVHCDIKGKNILVTSEGLKIADLGCAKWIDDVSNSDWETRITSIAGTPVYMAPEVARGEQQDFPADIWALGCTVIEMTTGRAPWTNVSDPVSVLYRIGFSCDVPEIPNSMSKEGKDFLSKCLRRDPKERWSASELLKHDFVTQPTNPMKETKCFSATPTSTLDIWDSFEDTETTMEETHESFLSYPMERIKKLTSNFPNWSWDESWITVRSSCYDINEPEILQANELTSVHEAKTSTSCGRRSYDFVVAIIAIAIAIAIVVLKKFIQTVNRCCTHRSISRLKRNAWLPCKCYHDFLWRNLDFRNMKFSLPHSMLAAYDQTQKSFLTSS
ncbi:mitogen-activated protein kinase kinase kinase 18-like [Carica papaya]|uniref:mitogen-activated protein kinase kinase kinase 18-like n=1 Tax=Carica papaya TaxID=3649 RepID=UPI000B8CCF1D|nr:mitogen-activated protein kinase kinase kinase 18-like [Carica papaya]